MKKIESASLTTACAVVVFTPTNFIRVLGLSLLASVLSPVCTPALLAAPDVFLTVHEHEGDEYLINRPIFVRLRANTDEVDGNVEETKFWVVSPDGSYNWWPNFSGGRLTAGEYGVLASGKDTEVIRSAEFTPTKAGEWQFRSTARINGTWYYSDFTSINVATSSKTPLSRSENTVTVKRIAYKDFYTLSEMYVGNDSRPTAYVWEAPIFQVGIEYCNTGVPRMWNLQPSEVIFGPFAVAQSAGEYPLYASESGPDSELNPSFELGNLPYIGRGSLVYGDHGPLGFHGVGFAVGTSKGTTWDMMKQRGANPTPYAIAHTSGGVDAVVTNGTQAMAALWNRLGLLRYRELMKTTSLAKISVPSVQGPKRLTLNGEVYAENALAHPETLAQNKVTSVKQNKRVDLWAEVIARMPKLANEERPDTGLSVPNNRVFVTAKIDYGVGTTGRYETVNVGAARSDRLGQILIPYTTPRLKSNSQGKLMTATVTFTFKSDMLRVGENLNLTFPEKNIGGSPRSTARIVVTP